MQHPKPTPPQRQRRDDKAIVPGTQRAQQFATPSRGETQFFFPKGNITVYARTQEEAEARYHEIIKSSNIETK